MQQQDRVAAAVRDLLFALGEDADRDGLKETPTRVARAYKELLSGRTEDPEKILGARFESDGYDEVVVLRNIPFSSLCEHHLMPFRGRAHVGYLPSGKVVGLSKLARVVDCFARRLQIQERLTAQVANAVQGQLEALGTAVIVEAEHSCMCDRGVRKPDALMVTSVMLGAFRDKPSARAEVLSLMKG